MDLGESHFQLKLIENHVEQQLISRSSTITEILSASNYNNEEAQKLREDFLNDDFEKL